MPTHYSPTQAARKLGVSTATVRRFADTFAEFLPDYAQIEDGQRREFTDADLRHLWAVIQLMNEQPQGTSRQDLVDLLHNGDSPPLVVPATLPDPGEVAADAETEAEEHVADSTPVYLPAPRGLDPELSQMVTSLISAQSTLVDAQSQQMPELLKRLERLANENRELRGQIQDLKNNRFSLFYATVWFGWGVLVTVGAIGLALWMLNHPELVGLPFLR